MIGVDLIGGIRRAYFEQRLPIKEIVRRLAVSRATVRRVIRSQKTEFKYQRGVQPVPKLGEWVAILSEMLEKEAQLPRRERRSNSSPSCHREATGAIDRPATTGISNYRGKFATLRWHRLTNTKER